MRKSEMHVGLIGAGFIGPAHVEALRRWGIEVVALAEINPEGAAERARQLRIPRWYASAEELLADPGINVVHITSPNHMHYPQAKAALLAGKHVVCEKPLALTSGESSELIQLAREKRLVNAVIFNARYYPLSQHARALIQGGGIGNVFSVQGSYLQDWLLLPTDWNWRLEPALGGEMRAVTDIGSHWIDLTSFITGLSVEAVFADFKVFLPVRKKPASPGETFTTKLQRDDAVEQPVHTEDWATVLFRYAGGGRGVTTVSQVSAGRKNRLTYEISGSHSAIAWDSERPNELWIGHRDRPNELVHKDPALLAPAARQFASFPGGHSEGFPDTFKQLFYSVYRYLEAGEFDAPPDFPTFEDGRRSLCVGEAIFRSAHEDRWVEVKEIDE